MAKIIPILLVVCAGTGAARAQLTVTATDPAANGRIVPGEPLTITFSQPVDPATVTVHSLSIVGAWSGPAARSVQWSPDARTATVLPWWPLFAGERVTVTLAHSIASTTGVALGHGVSWQLFATCAPSSRTFAPAETIQLRLPGEGRLGTYGIFAGDVDGDGAPDLTSMNEISNDIRLQHNSGCGTFGAATIVDNPGQWPSPNRGGDFDHDGRMDLVTGNQNGGAVSIYRNDGAGGFLPPVVYPTGGYVHGIAVADFDGDGWWDIAAPNGAAVSILRNHGDGTFEAPVAYDAGGTGEDNVSAVDFDGDGIVDLAVGNLYSNTMGFLHGQGDGTFVLQGTFPTGGQPFHQTCGDCNGDGHPDVLFANRGSDTFAILFGDGLGGFAAPVTYAVGQTPAAIEVGDLDGDGDLDCVVANYSSADYSVWWNRGDGTFEQPVTLPAAQAGSCSTLVDFDRDGILDIIGADENADVAILYRQRGLAPSSAQPPSCAATLRIAQRADGSGFGAPPLQLRPWGNAVLGVSGPDNAMALIAVGPAQPIGVPFLGIGLLNIDIAAPPAIDLELLDSRGEYTWRMIVPGTAPRHFPLAVQAIVGSTADFVLSNAQAVVIAP